MGKVKTKRAPLHGKAAKVPGQASSTEADPAPAAPAVPTLPPTLNLDGIFSKANIDLNAMARDLPGKGFDDTKSAITSKSLKGMNLKKTDKRKMKREFFMKRMDTLKQAKKDLAEKKKRQKTPVVGDMQGLADTLPTLDLLMRDLGKPQETVKRGPTKPKQPGCIQKEHKRKQQMKKNLATFQQVMKVPEYKANPLSAITEHLANMVEQEKL